MQIKVIHEEQQVGVGVPREGTLSKELHNIQFKVYCASLVGDAGDLITNVTALSCKLVTTIEREKHQWGGQVATFESMQKLITNRLNTSLSW